MVVHPGEYRWSSHHYNANGADEARITPHPYYLELGAHPTARREAYRSLFDEALSLEDTEALRAHTHQQRAWGSDRFQAQIEALTHRAAALRPRVGRLLALNEPDPLFPLFSLFPVSLRSTHPTGLTQPTALRSTILRA